MDLQERIRKIIASELEQLTGKSGTLAGRRTLNLVPFVGNGLSRIALARQPEHSDSSYYSLVDKYCEKLGYPKLDHLISRGFMVDEVFRLIVEKSGLEARLEIMYEIWRLFRDIVPDVESGFPSPLHIALAKTAKAFITTNYDLMIERTLLVKGINRYDENYCIAVPMNKGNVSEKFTPWDETSGTVWIYKIHGSFGKLPNSFPDHEPLSDGIFNNIQKKTGGIDTIVASADIYNWWAYECSNEEFGNKFHGPIDILRSYKNLVLIIGHGMRAEERIIFRLLQMAIPSGGYNFSAPIVMLTFEHKEDAITSRESHLISTINVPPGLAGSASKRELAHLILLDELSNKEIIYLDTESKRYVQSSLHHFPALPIEPSKTLAEMTPLVVSAGQMAYHTTRGLETAPSQERAYSPKIAGWKPNDTAERILEIANPMGDALVPSYLWEGLGIPCALTGRVACDSAGRSILDYLGNNTQYIDFSNISQDINPKAKTEQATVVCWMDLRLIIDGERSFGYDVNIDAILPKKSDGRVIYASKPALSSVAKSLDENGKDLLVFDTGGNCKASEFYLALSKRSVIIASAISLYQYIKTWEIIKNEDITKIDDVWKPINDNYSREEPTDETGRYKQIALILHKLDEIDFDLTKTRMGESLGATVALACTLGPLGCLWWGKDKSQPVWTHVVTDSPPNNKDISGQSIPFKEIRNALGCGDTARAGYIASVVVQGLGAGDLQFDQFRAFEAMVWAGTCRIMFWDIKEFGKWLQTVRPLAIDWLRLNNHLPPWPDDLGNVNDRKIREIQHMSLSDPDHRKELMEYVRTWETEILGEQSKDTRTQKWLDSIEEWRNKRHLKSSR